MLQVLSLLLVLFTALSAAAETKVPIGTGRFKHQAAPTGSTPSGYVDVYCKSDNKCYKRDSTATESELGSGAGGAGAFNIAILDDAASSWAATETDNADFETAAGAWAAYADAAATTPADMTGGSPNTTCARSTSSPLNGTGSLLVTVTTGASRQGEGCSLAVNIPPGYRGKLLRVSFPFETTGTIAAGDFVPYAYDVTNTSLLAPSATISGISGSSGQLVSMFQTQSSTAVLRIGLHIARTSTGAATIKLDDVKVEPDLTQANVPMSDWASTTAWTPSAGFGSTTSRAFFSRRVGDSLQVWGRWTNGTLAASTASLDATVHTIDFAKIGANTVRVGTWTRHASGANISGGDREGPIFIDGSTSGSVFFGYQAGANEITKATGSALFDNSTPVSVNFTIPISGWSSGGGTSPILSLSDWSDETSLFAYDNAGTVANHKVYTRRVGDTLHVQGSFEAGTPSASAIAIDIPSKYVIDAAKIPSNSKGSIVGEAVNTDNGSGQIYAGVATVVFFDGSDTGKLYLAVAETTSGLAKVNGSSIVVSGDQVTYKFSVPIVGWTSTSSGTLTAPRCELWVKTANGYGSTSSNKIRRWTTTVTNTGDCVTYTDSSSDGGSFTFTREGLYTVCYGDVFSAAATMGISLNSNQLTTDFLSITNAHGIASMSTGGNDFGGNVCATRKFSIGDVVRAHTGGTSSGSNTIHAMFRITQVMH